MSVTVSDPGVARQSSPIGLPSSIITATPWGLINVHKGRLAPEECIFTYENVLEGSRVVRVSVWSVRSYHTNRMGNDQGLITRKEIPPAIPTITRSCTLVRRCEKVCLVTQHVPGHPGNDLHVWNKGTFGSALPGPQEDFPTYKLVFLHLQHVY